MKNAVLLIHGTTGTGKEFLAKGFRDAMFEPGQPLDAAKYYLILPDAIGLGGSSKPSDGLHDRFPRYGYKDMVAAEERLVTEGLGIKHLRVSFWYQYGRDARPTLGRTIPGVNGRNHPGGLPAGENCGSESALAPYHYNAVRSDPEWNGGDYHRPPSSLASVYPILKLMTSNAAQLQQELGSVEQVNAWLESIAEFCRSGQIDANDMVHRFEASADYDPAPGFEKIQAAVLAINFADDELKMGFVDFITPQVNKRVKEVITRMRESQIESRLARCGYTDTDYLLAAQATAAEVVTGYASIDGIDLDAELRTRNAERGGSALRTLMENAKRTATDFLVPPEMLRAIRKAGAGDPYAFWRQFSPEEKFLLKGLEGEAQGVFKIGAFQDLGRAFGLSAYEELMGPTKANDSRTKLPKELPRPDAIRFDEVLASHRGLWTNSPTRNIYHALKLLEGGAEIDRAIKHLIDTTDFWNTRSTRLASIIAYLQATTSRLEQWAPYQDHLAALAIGVENARG